MLAKCLREEQVSGVDERLVRAVHIIVEQYDGDVRAFVEAIRGHVKVVQGTEASVQATRKARRGRTREH